MSSSFGRNGHLSRRALLAGAGGALAATTLPACSGASGASTLTMHQSKPEAISYFSQLAEDFSQSQSSYRVQHDIATNLSASFVRNNPPDLGCLNYNLEMGRFMERGALADLADLPAASDDPGGRPGPHLLVRDLRGSNQRDPVLGHGCLSDLQPTHLRRARPRGPHHLGGVPQRVRDAQSRRRHSRSTAPSWIRGRSPRACSTTPSAAWSTCVPSTEDLHELGEDVGPDSEVSFQRTLLEPVERMIELVQYTNPDASNRGYGDGNTAMAQEKAAMYFQGPWAFGEIEKSGEELDLGTFPLPMTDDPADLKVRVNIDLSLWVPEAASEPTGAREFLQYLMQPSVAESLQREVPGLRHDEERACCDGRPHRGDADVLRRRTFLHGCLPVHPELDPGPELHPIDRGRRRSRAGLWRVWTPTGPVSPSGSESGHDHGAPSVPRAHEQGVRMSTTTPTRPSSRGELCLAGRTAAIPQAQDRSAVLLLPVPVPCPVHRGGHGACTAGLRVQLHQLHRLRRLGVHRSAELHRNVPGPGDPRLLCLHPRLLLGHRA